MKKIKLAGGVFEYDPNRKLGKPGGFGQVFFGKTVDGQQVAVKKLYISAEEAAHRELRVADGLQGRDLHFVIPYVASGEDADSGEYFVIMAKATKSLQDHIEEGGVLKVTETASVLADVANGLM